jgi:inorganic triphosphatase YgiF
MAQEIELKLSLPRRFQRRFSELPILARYSQQAQVTMALANRYFDTPALELNRHAVALRIRRSGEQFIQTLKTRGSSQGGLHQRNEWEWLVPSDQLQLELLPKEALPVDLDSSQLQPAFNTDFERSCWQLRYPFEEPMADHAAGADTQQAAEIELVLDNGWVSANGQQDPISEIELELKAGPAEALFALALELAEAIPLRVSRISKAERGLRLFKPEATRQPPDRPPGLNYFDPDCCQQWLERLQALAEAYLFIPDAEVKQALAQSLEGLAQQLLLAGEAGGALLGPIEQQQSELERLLGAGASDQALIAWLDSQALSLVLLQISYWLYTQTR